MQENKLALNSILHRNTPVWSKNIDIDNFTVPYYWTFSCLNTVRGGICKILKSLLSKYQLYQQWTTLSTFSFSYIMNITANMAWLISRLCVSLYRLMVCQLICNYPPREFKHLLLTTTQFKKLKKKPKRQPWHLWFLLASTSEGTYENSQ